jgi:CBS-domain-containing membrane protein
MQVTKTTHPPAGATAILAAVSSDVRAMGWYYLPVILLSSALAMTVALIINNIRRRYPLFWFHPHPSVAPIRHSPYSTAASTRVNSVEALSVKEKDADDKEGKKIPNTENIV